MKQVTKVSPRAKKNAFGRLLTPTLAIVAAATALLPTNNAIADETDLTAVGVDAPQPVHATIGGDGLVANDHTQPAGTGVFDPFLTLERKGGTSIESAYNTDGQHGGLDSNGNLGANALYLDQQRPEWNTYLKLSDLAICDPNHNGGSYYAFELDANEPGADKSLLSIDNVRIYTSTGDNTL